MELGSAQQFLKGKTVLVTGATGFLAKVFVEKLLRTQSDLKKIYVLLRASHTDAATKRLHDEIISKELFRVLRDKWGEDFDSFISEKVVAVAGDVSLASLGLEDGENVEKKISKEIDIIVNVAATTNFNERFDVAIGVNTMGPLHVLNFAKTCPKIPVLLHVSTAYVCGEAKEDGKVIKEEPFQMGQTLNVATRLNIEEEKILMEKMLQELGAKNVDENALKSAMTEYGIERANLHGWPNTYVFTKAMGEMFLSHLKDNIPLIIIRPTVVTSTFREPFPGWVEGFRTIDQFIGGYGKGMITCVMSHPKIILDVIPADMVINCMLAAILNVTIINRSRNEAHQENYIYHIGSSFRNPLTMSHINDLQYLYFSKNPLTDENGKPIKVPQAKFLTSMPSFERHMLIRYVLPLNALKLVSKVCCLSFLQDVYYRSGHRKVQRAIRMAKIYEPYLLFKAIFNDANTDSLRMATKKEKGGFDIGFDPLSIDWTDYMINVHTPGFIKFAMK